MTNGSTAGIGGNRLGRVFWLLCSMEMWERLAYYGMRVIVPIYIAQADEPGGLHFSQAEKGTIYAWWFVFQSVLPTFTGGYADRYGYKKTIFWAINLKIVGYIMMATMTSFWGFFAGTMMLATGTAIFKPGIQGTLAHQMDDTNSSKGWGTFYWLVNVGAMCGPPLAGMLRKLSWPWVFYGCAIIVSINYLMLLTYKDPESGYDGKDDPVKVMVVTLRNLFDARLMTFLLILSGFWLMMYQLWDLHPNFIADWVDSRDVAETLPVPEAWTHSTDRGTQMLQENLLNLNAALIVLLMVPVSIAVAKMRTLTAMLIGMMIATCGIIAGGVTMSGWVLLVAIFFFSMGEMLTGPKKNEYLALIAPPGKKGLYLGYVNVPVGIGGFIGSKLAGWLYGDYGEKATLAMKHLIEKTDYLVNRPAVPDGAGVATAEQLFGVSGTQWGMAWKGDTTVAEAVLGFPRGAAYETLKERLGQDGVETTVLLWDTYQPYQVWYAFAAIGIASIVALLIYNQRAKKWADLNV